MQAINSITGGDINVSNFLNGSAPSAVGHGQFNSNSLTAISREELMRRMGATVNGFSLAPTLNASNLNHHAAMQQQRQRRPSLVNATAAQKREGGYLGGQNGIAKKLRLSTDDAAVKQPQAPVPTNSNMMNAARLLASAATELELKERTEAARMIASLAYPASNTKDRFPLPPKVAPKKARTFAPKMNSYRKAWDDVKSKDMRKEIFLRKLHQGTLFNTKASKTVAKKTEEVDVKPSPKAAQKTSESSQPTDVTASQHGQSTANCQAV